MQSEVSRSAGSVGLVETRRVVLFTSDDPLVLDSGAQLAHVEVAYETYGELDASASNCVFVSRERVADEHAVGRGRVELAVGLVRDLDEVQLLAGFEHERVALVPERDPPCLHQTERALGAPRYVDHATP